MGVKEGVISNCQWSAQLHFYPVRNIFFVHLKNATKFKSFLCLFFFFTRFVNMDADDTHAEMAALAGHRAAVFIEVISMFANNEKWWL